MHHYRNNNIIGYNTIKYTNKQRGKLVDSNLIKELISIVFSAASATKILHFNRFSAASADNLRRKVMTHLAEHSR